MDQISKADDDLFGLASTAAKLGRAGRLLDRLADAHHADPADPVAASRYGLALMATVRPGIEAHAGFTTAIEVFGQVLAGTPEHWLARYSRARLRALVPSSYGSFTVQVPDELGKAEEDLDILCTQQAAVPAQPYFASAHALAAVVARLTGDESGQRRRAHVAALSRCPRIPARLPALGAMLCEPLVTLYAAGLDPPEREPVGELMSALYGDQRAVREARHRQPVR